MRAIRDPRLPQISFEPRDFRVPQAPSYVGIDLEWHVGSGRPYLASAATESFVVSAPWESMRSLMEQICGSPHIQLVGHNVSQADVPVLERELGIEIPLSRQQDTLLRFYLVEQHLAGTDAKVDGEGGFELRRGGGRLRLGSLAAAYTDLAVYKECRGVWCIGPCPVHQEREYNALDAWAALDALPRLLEAQRRKDIPETLYEHLLRLNACCESFPPIPIDLDKVAEIESELSARQQELFPSRTISLGKRGQPLKNPRTEYEGPFNPRSPKGIRDYFDPLLKRPLKTTEAEYLQRRSPPTDPAASDLWRRLLEYKQLGKGLTAWVAPEYLHDIDLEASRAALRPRWIAYGSSSGRVASASPNVQNFPKWGLMAEVRKAVVAPPGMRLVAMDAGQLELRVMLLRGGFLFPREVRDVFTAILDMAREAFQAVSDITPNAYLKKPRNIVKRMTHAFDYGEGLQLVSPEVVASQKWRNRHNPEILDGSYKLVQDWTFLGRFCAFTGANLATALYGDASRESRAKALKLQDLLLRKMPALLQAQRSILRYVEEHGRAQSSTGRCLDLPMLGSDLDKAAKLALAHEGQGVGADYMQEGLKRLFAQDLAPILFVHDEFVVPVPDSWSDDRCRELASSLEREYPLTGAMWCPFSCKVGKSYGDLRTLAS